MAKCYLGDCTSDTDITCDECKKYACQQHRIDDPEEQGTLCEDCSKGTSEEGDTF